MARTTTLPLVLSVALLATACSHEVDPCQQAADHIEECLGMPAEANADCTASEAQSILDQDCDELRASQGKGDFLSFLCKVFGIFCPAYEPCGDKTCGDPCTVCDPADPDCFETQELKFCTADGTCAASVPTCDAPICNPGAPGDGCETFTCGGSFARPCPVGSHCADDTTDGCDPATGGADCAGVCACDDPSQCDIIQCGGTLARACPDPSTQTCLDLPDDGCSPTAGGADCGGYCATR